jgi:hypothetical protein
MGKTGFQCQKIPANLETLVREGKPTAVKLIDLNRGAAEAVKRAYPQCILIGRWFSTHSYNSIDGRAYADLASRAYDPLRDLLDAVEGINEPIVFTPDEARRLNQWQVDFANRMRELGWGGKIGAYQFSVGHPEVFLPNGEINPSGGMWQYLWDGMRASNWLGLHEYGAPTLQHDAAYLSLRHRAIYEVAPTDLKTKPLYITESGIDWGIYPGHVLAGFWAESDNTPDYMAQLQWYDEQLRQDDYVHCATVFLAGHADARWESFDVLATPERTLYFVNLLKQLQTGDGTVPPEPPPQSSGGTTPVDPYVFPPELTAIGAIGKEGKVTEGNPFYRIAQTAAVTTGVSAFAKVTVIGKSAPAIGVQVVNRRPDGKGEIGVTDGGGNVTFNFGRGSEFYVPGQGPFTVFVAKGAVKDDETKNVTWQAILSDIVESLGDWQGAHTEAYMQFTQQDLQVQPAPPTQPPILIGNPASIIQQLAWVPFGGLNADAAFQKYANEHELGRPTTTENRTTINGVKWAWQGFDKAILATEEGNWGNIREIAWL